MQERILNLLSMCMQAKKNGHDCFFDYAPHCDKIEIRIYMDGWKKAERDETGGFVPGTDGLTDTFLFYTDEDCEREMSKAETCLKGLIL
jgi:hypothetical protein